MPIDLLRKSAARYPATTVERSFPRAPRRQDLGQDRIRRVTRLLRIITLLNTGRKYGLRALADACACSTKTVQRDLTYWRELDVAVDYDLSRGSYGLTGPLPFPVLEVTVAEATALALAEASAGVSGGQALADGVSSAFEKIRGLVPDQVAARLEGIRDGLLTSSAANRDYSQAPLGILLEACRRRLTVVVDYDSFSSGRRVRPIEPYGVAYLAGFWMVVARDPERNDVRKFSLDRVYTCTFPQPDRRFTVPANWSLTAFTAGSVGVLRGEKTAIALRFERDAAGYARGKNWRFPCEIAENEEDGSIVLTGAVAGIEEIMWEVLRWGRHVTVLEPAALRERVAEEARVIAAKYV